MLISSVCLCVCVCVFQVECMYVFVSAYTTAGVCMQQMYTYYLLNVYIRREKYDMIEG